MQLFQFMLIKNSNNPQHIHIYTIYYIINKYKQIIQMDSADLVEFYYQQINKLRKQPKSIESLLRDRLNRLVKQQDKEKQINCYSHYQFGNVMFKTVEGDKAIKDALSYIDHQPKLKPLVLSEKLCQIAYQMGLQMQKSHKQIDLTVYKQPLKKLLLSYMPQIRQKIQILVEYGFRKDIDLLTNIIIDDGNYQRSRRLTLMNEEWQSVGISVHQHYEFDFFVVMLFSNHQEPVETCQCQIF